MERIRSYYDSDFNHKINIPTEYKTAQNRNNIPCSMCGRKIFVNDTIFEEMNREIAVSGENNFLCEECLWENEDEYSLL